MIYAAATSGQASLQVVPDQRTILIGMPVHLKAEIIVPDANGWQLDTGPQSTHWVWLDGDTATMKIEGRGKKVEKTLVLTSYDTGYWLLPQLYLKRGAKRIAADTLGIRVLYTTDDLTQDYRDIKDIVETPPPATGQNTRLWVASIFTILALLFLLYFSRRKNKHRALDAGTNTVQPDAGLAWEQMFSAYRKREMNAAQFYVKADQLLREQLSRQGVFDAVHATSQEISLALAMGSASVGERELLLAFFRQADLVKFAKLMPDEDELVKYYERLKPFIQSSK